MVGDGINGAPSLALADVGIAMGIAGTDAAIEAADVTLINDDLGRVAEFVEMSRKVLRRIKWNIFFSIIYNAIGLALATLGMLTPVLAVIFQEAGCVTVVLSSTLLLWTKPKLVDCPELLPRNENRDGEKTEYRPLDPSAPRASTRDRELAIEPD